MPRCRLQQDNEQSSYDRTSSPVAQVPPILNMLDLHLLFTCRGGELKAVRGVNVTRSVGPARSQAPLYFARSGSRRTHDARVCVIRRDAIVEVAQTAMLLSAPTPLYAAR